MGAPITRFHVTQIVDVRPSFSAGANVNLLGLKPQPKPYGYDRKNQDEPVGAF